MLEDAHLSSVYIYIYICEFRATQLALTCLLPRTPQERAGDRSERAMTATAWP